MAEKVGKSTLVLEVMPASDEVNLDDLEKKIREVAMDGLLWGKSQRKEACFGLFALQIGAVVTDDVDVQGLEDELSSWEDWISSEKIIAFQKI